ncbi:MAG: HDIG domain-containing protein [Paludibacter sp.]|jgi:uncharacterized protein|nr:HDIG domain-containing protein [Paludibacter sp.]
MPNPLLLIEKYYEPSSKLYKLLVAHSEQVRDKALFIARQNPELQIDTTFVAEAAMLHDIGIFMCYAPSIYCFGTHRYIEHGYLGAELLRNEGFESYALVCERHTGAGISLKMVESQNLPLPHRDFMPVSIEEKLICYADKFFSKSQPDSERSKAEVCSELSRYGDEQVATFEHWHSIFAKL